MRRMSKKMHKCAYLATMFRGRRSRRYDDYNFSRPRRRYALRISDKYADEHGHTDTDTDTDKNTGHDCTLRVASQPSINCRRERCRSRDLHVAVTLCGHVCVPVRRGRFGGEGSGSVHGYEMRTRDVREKNANDQNIMIMLCYNL